MDIAALTIDANRLWPGEAAGEGPLCFVDLDATAAAPEAVLLPPCPVIGLGSAAHPLARHLDATIEPPIGAAGLARPGLARPHAPPGSAELVRPLPAPALDGGLR